MAAVILSFCTIFPAGLATAADSPVADAAERLDRAKLNALLEKSADINAAQADGMTALHWAVYLDDLPLAKLLVTAGANVKAENRYGVTPLSLACTNGNTAIVELLLAAGADANTKLSGGETVLMTAARTGVLGPVKALLAAGAKVNDKERKGQTALMWASSEGNSAVVQALLAAGADFRTALPSGFTPLFFAVREGRAEVVQILLKAGADVNAVIQARPANGKAPTSGSSPLILAIENGHFELAVALMDAGADANDLRTGYSPLHVMTWVRKPNRGDGDDGEPPPKGSGKLTSLQFVKALVAHGADVNLRLKRGPSGKGTLARTSATPFLMAAATADTPYMKALVELGANPALVNAEHTTPLMAAAGIGVKAIDEEAGTEPEVIEAIEFLLSLGGNVNAVDDNGETAMHGAAYRAFPKVAQLLADKGAKVSVWNQKNKHGWSPLDIAEGYRFGNFRPSPNVVAVLHGALAAAGVSPPAASVPAASKTDYPEVMPPMMPPP